LFSGQVFSVPSKAPEDSNRFERGAAMALRGFVFLILAYVVFHKIFPFALFRTRLADMTGADFSLMIVRSLIAIAGAAYLVMRGFMQPALQERDRGWCERWAALAFGVITLVIGSIVITSLQPTASIVVVTAYWLATGILWLLF
jgi:uncharacterized membrane protein HdeD (DUF308 family)